MLSWLQTANVTQGGHLLRLSDWEQLWVLFQGWHTKGHYDVRTTISVDCCRTDMLKGQLCMPAQNALLLVDCLFMEMAVVHYIMQWKDSKPPERCWLDNLPQRDQRQMQDKSWHCYSLFPVWLQGFLEKGNLLGILFKQLSGFWFWLWFYSGPVSILNQLDSTVTMTEDIPVPASISEYNRNVPSEKPPLQVIDIIDQIANSVEIFPFQNAEPNPGLPLTQDNQEGANHLVKNTAFQVSGGEKEPQGKMPFCDFFSPSPISMGINKVLVICVCGCVSVCMHMWVCIISQKYCVWMNKSD